MENQENNKEITLEDLVPKAKKYEEQLEERFREKVCRNEFEKLQERVKTIEEALAIKSSQ